MNTLCYVLTTSGKDKFAEMARVSAISVRITNPEWRVVVVCDSASRDGLGREKHGLLEVVDEVVGVKVPEGSPEFRNRWMKTQLIQFVDQDAVFMDSDTIVRKPLGPVLSAGTSFGGVANHNGLGIGEQLWSEDERVLNIMGWPTHFRCYINGGMWAFRERSFRMVGNSAARLWIRVAGLVAGFRARWD